MPQTCSNVCFLDDYKECSNYNYTTTTDVEERECPPAAKRRKTTAVVDNDFVRFSDGQCTNLLHFSVLLPSSHIVDANILV